jgi:pimeloyl-ACP methyl ester carboxylesterase
VLPDRDPASILGQLINKGWQQMSLRMAGILLLAGLILSGCASVPLQPFTDESTPLMLVPAIQREDQDKRGRFREIFCEILEARKSGIDNYRPCDEALAQVGPWPAGSGKHVNLGPAKRRLKVVFVPGIGWGCFSTWLSPEDAVSGHLKTFGYDMVTVDVNGLSGSEYNAGKIRDAVMGMPTIESQAGLVLVGYSKGASDVLMALVNHPEILDRVVAVVSLAGAVGGSPLANDASEDLLNLLQRLPVVTCERAAGSALLDLRPDTRMAWLADHHLPASIPYYSLVSFPDPSNISSALLDSYRKLSQVDARNDGQLIFYDQFIPDSTLLGYLNADHWAVAPITRNLGVAGEILANRTNFPRDALFEALLRFIEEDLDSRKSERPGRVDEASLHSKQAD